MSTLTTINEGDQITDSRAVINNNFTALNNEKIETSYLDTDTSLTANSDTKIPSQKAVKAYVDAGGDLNTQAALAGVSGIAPSASNKFMDSRAMTGTVTSFAGTSVPTGWLTSDGTAISRSTYSALFGVIGTTYGVGDNSTTFNLPNISIGSIFTNVVSYWTFNGSSGNATDSKGVNTLTNNNTATYAAGKMGNGTDLEAGSSQFFSIADGSQTGLDILGNITLACWVKVESLPGSGAEYGIISKWNSTGNQRSYRFDYYNNGGTPQLQFGASDTGGSTTLATKAYTLTTGTWFHLAVTWTAATSTAEFYVNGTSIGTSTTGSVTAIFNSTADFYIGGIVGGSYFDGMIDEAGVWNTVLTANQVAALYNSGNGLTYPTLISGDSLSKIIKY